MNTTGPSETLDHQTTLMGTLSGLFNKEEFSDLRLVVNQTLSLNVHRFILAVRSEVFRALLDTERWADAKGRVVQLTEDGDCLAHFPDFLRYLYSGSVALDTGNALALHALSEKYAVGELRESCRLFMLANVAAPGTCNRAVSWHRYAKLAGLGRLEEQCLRFIGWNLDTVIESPDWAQMEPGPLGSLLQRSDLVVEDEAVLFRALASWLSPRPGRAQEMLAHLRYPMMPPDKLFELQAPGGLAEGLASYLLRESLLVYQAHLLPAEAIARQHDLTAIPFTMRLYTAGSVSALWDIPGYGAMSKTVLSKSMYTRFFQLKTEWSLTYFPKGHRIVTQRHTHYTYHGYDQVVQEDDFATLSVSVTGCDPADKSHSHKNHSHKLSVLLYRRVRGEWFVCEVKTLEVPHGGEAEIHDLIPLSERDQYVSDDTMKLCLVGQTVWEKSESV